EPVVEIVTVDVTGFLEVAVGELRDLIRGDGRGRRGDMRAPRAPRRSGGGLDGLLPGGAHAAHLGRSRERPQVSDRVEQRSSGRVERSPRPDVSRAFRRRNNRPQRAAVGYVLAMAEGDPAPPRGPK